MLSYLHVDEIRPSTVVDDAPAKPLSFSPNECQAGFASLNGSTAPTLYFDAATPRPTSLLTSSQPIMPTVSSIHHCSTARRTEKKNAINTSRICVSAFCPLGGLIDVHGQLSSLTSLTLPDCWRAISDNRMWSVDRFIPTSFPFLSFTYHSVGISFLSLYALTI